MDVKFLSQKKTWVGDIRWLAVVLSILLSALILNTNHPPISQDGLIYLQAAQIFLNQGFHATLANFNWPFYPVVIGSVSMLTHLPLEQAAQVWDTAMVAVFVFSFLSILRQLTPSMTCQWFGLFIILFLPELNILRKLPVLRDFSYWGFVFLSLFYLIRYSRTRRLQDALLWGIAAIVSGLFRIEGFIIAYSMPLIFLSLPMNWSKRSLRCGVAYIVPFLIFVAVGIASLLTPIEVPQNRLIYHVIGIWRGLTHHLHDVLIILQRDIFSAAQQRMALASFSLLFFGFLGLIFVMIIKLLSVLYAVLSGYAFFYGHLSKAGFAHRIIVWFMLINIVILMIFLFAEFFVADRYLLTLCFSALLFAPFGLGMVYEHWKNRSFVFTGRRWVFPLIVLLMIGLAVPGIDRRGYSKAYITRSGEWVAMHAPASATVCSNHAIALYYTKRAGVSSLLSPDSLPFSCQYVLLIFSRHDHSCMMQWTESLGEPMQQFPGPHGARALIWSRPVVVSPR